VETAQPSTHREVARDAAHSDEAGSIECLRLPNASADLVIAVHSLEHVDDRKALTEIRRVLRPGGELIAMVPLVEGWARTYEDPTINAASDREAHFGHANHLRWYGADFRDLLGASGFSVEEFTAGPEDSVRFALQRGEKVFRAR
jgi:SAM-dependent methyltransferase